MACCFTYLKIIIKFLNDLPFLFKFCTLNYRFSDLVFHIFKKTKRQMYMNTDILRHRHMI